MSMICYLLGITPAQISALRADPSLVSKVASTAQDADSVRSHEEMMKSMPPEQRKKLEASRATFEASPAMRDFKAELEEARKQVASSIGPFEQALCLEKSWHMLHYLFTGHVGPANAPGDLLLTGEDLGEDVGYGPARLHDPLPTRAFSDFIQTQDLTRLQARINLDEMNRVGVYAMPFGGSAAEHAADLRDALDRFFPLLRDYVRTMSGKGNGLLTWVS